MIHLSDTLLLPDQEALLRLTRADGDPQPKQVWLHHHIYEGRGSKPECRPLSVRWAADGTVGEATLTLPDPGNYAITIGKDNLEVCRKPVTTEDPTSPVSAYRYLACIGPDSLVIRHMVAATSNPFSALIHGYRAAVDYFMLGLGQPAHDYPFFERHYGDTVAPIIHPPNLQAAFPDLSLENSNWRVYPDDVIRRLVLYVKQRWEQIGYRPLTILGTYTPSPGLIRACRELGIHTITQQCPGQYWIDGGWELANPGMPDIPYFMSEEDVRRPQAPSPEGVLAAAQCQFVAPTCYRYWLENVLDSSCFQREERANENGAVPWRAIDLLDAFVNGSRATGGPDVLNIGVEGGESLWAHSILRINRALIQRSITQAQRGGGRIVFGTSEAVRQFAIRNGGATWPPARLSIVPDVFAGRDFSRKPLIESNVATADLPAFRADFTERSSLPLAIWPRTGSRASLAYPGAKPAVPFSDVRDGWPTGCVPYEMGVSKARVRWRSVRGGSEVEVKFTSASQWDYFPVLLWQPPVLPTQLDGETEEGLRWMSSRPWDGRVDAIMIFGPIRRPGQTTWKAFIPGKPAAAREEDVVDLTPELKLARMPKSFEVERHAYLIKTKAGTLDVKITAGVSRVETHEGAQSGPEGSFTLTNESPYLRLWLKRTGTVKARSRFTPQREVKRFSVEKDTARLHEWVRSKVLRPDERLVFSLACFRKCTAGTWTHPLQEDYLAIAEDGMHYEADRLDYGQAWAAGHTAWVCPWALGFSLHGADALKGRQARIHLHAYDYAPGLNRNFLVAANNQLVRGFSQWVIPEGPEARFSPQSVFSFDVDDALIAAGRIAITLGPVMRLPVRDWIKDKAFSLLLSDVWVSVESKR
jgi:hypothetical protein